MNLFDQAQKWIQTRTSSRDEPESYRVVCPGGNQLRGTRSESYQIVRCPDCHCGATGVFVLPTSPFSEPPPPPQRSRASKVTQTSVADPGDPEITYPEDVQALRSQPESSSTGTSVPRIDLEVPWEEDLRQNHENAAQELSPKETRRSSGPSDPNQENLEQNPEQNRQNRPRRQEPPQNPSPSRPAHRPNEARTSGRKRLPRGTHQSSEVRQSVRRPLATFASRHQKILVFSAVLIVVLTTVAYRSIRSQFQEYPRLVELGLNEGIPALKEGRFDAAYRILEQARRGVNALKSVPDAGEIRQAANEAEILVNLIDRPLEDLIEEAARFRPLEDWPSYFQRRYSGQTVILEAQVESINEETGAQLAMVVPTGIGPLANRVGEFAFNDFELLGVARGISPGSRVLFGAALQSLELDRLTDRWVFRLRPESGVLMTYPEALVQLGWPKADYQLKAKFTDQDELLGQTRGQALATLGPPERMSRLATRGLIQESWFYGSPGDKQQILVFPIQPGTGEPIVRARYQGIQVY